MVQDPSATVTHRPGMPGPWDEDPSGSIGIHRMGMDRDGMGMGWPMMSMREWMEWMGMAHDEHEGFGPLHDGWPMLHAA